MQTNNMIMVIPLLLMMYFSIADGSSIAGTTGTGNDKYKGAKLLSLDIESYKQWDFLLDKFLGNLDVWKDPAPGGGVAQVLVLTSDLAYVLRQLARYSVTYDVTVEDVSTLIDGDDARKRRSAANEVEEEEEEEARTVLNSYATLDEITTWMRGLSEEHSDLITMMDIGKTHEGRSLNLLKMGVKGGTNKWSFWLDCGIHAREWISPSTCIQIVNHLLKSYQSTSSDRRLLERIDWYIMPVLNADGYAYTHSEDRFWRKNRRPVSDMCFGVDLNRNWSYKWGGTMASKNPCRHTYRGPSAASELETQAVAGFIERLGQPFRAFISLHSYGQMVISRWGYGTQKTSDHSHMQNIIRRMSEEIKNTHQKTYATGTAPDLLYAFSGGSGDWARGVARIKYAVALELRDSVSPSNFNNGGFAIPPSNIVPTGEEIFAAVKVIANQIIDYDSFPSEDVKYPGTVLRTTTSDNVTTSTDPLPDLQTSAPQFSRRSSATRIGCSALDFRLPTMVWSVAAVLMMVGSP